MAPGSVVRASQTGPATDVLPSVHAAPETVPATAPREPWVAATQAAPVQPAAPAAGKSAPSAVRTDFSLYGDPGETKH